MEMKEHNYSQYGLNPLPGETGHTPRQFHEPNLEAAPVTPINPLSVPSSPGHADTTPAPEPMPQATAMTFPAAVMVMAGVIVLLLVVVAWLAFRHSESPMAQAATAAKDSDIEVQGTSQVVDEDGEKYLFKGRITNTGEAIAPSVALKPSSTTHFVMRITVFSR